MRDLPALWTSEAWREDLEAWLVPALAAAGRTVTGPLVPGHVRFWSTVLHVETDGGRVWVKENAPSQAFEGALVDAVGRLAPGAVPPVLALDPDHGRFATADLGAPLWHDDTVPPLDAWVTVVADHAVLQRDLARSADALLATGLPRFPADPDAVVAWVEEVVSGLGAHPDGDPGRLTPEEEAGVRRGLERVHDAAAALAGSGLPDSLQHNDLHLGNAVRSGGTSAVIDLADALWTHPLTTLRIPAWTVRTRLGLADGDPGLERLIEAALAPWAGLVDPADLRALLPAAERVSCLHRAASWHRLQGDVPASAVDDRFRRAVPEWLVIATAPDPFATAVAL